MSSLLQNMCRTCMLNDFKYQTMPSRSKVKMKTAQMVPIFIVPEDSNDELSLMEILKTTVPQLKVEENDQLPKNVCLECTEKIKEIYRFQQNCLSVEQKFYKMLEEHNSSDPFDDEDVFKTEVDDNFVNETSLQSDDDLIVEDDIKIEAATKDEFTENCSDFSIDFVWDEKSDSDWEEEQRKPKLRKKSKDTKSEPNGDEILENVYTDDNKNGENKSTLKIQKRSTGRKVIGTQQMYPCDKCNRKLKSMLSLKNHQELHNKQEEEDQIFKCNVCNKVFEKKYDLKEHSRTHIGELPFLCSDCGKGFSSAGGLKQHSFRHLYKKQFACPDCPRSFPTKADLLGHSSTHKDIPKKHLCDVCGRGFKTQFLLKQHKRYHNSEKPFGCEFCEKRFVTKDKLKRHTRIHTGEKPFKCKYCEKAYNQSNELTKHLSCHLGENVYQCKLCPQRFSTVKIVREHFATHKNDDEETRARNLAELNAMEVQGIFIR